MNTLKQLPLKSSHRIESIDILRGIVMLIMAIDYIREFFHHGSLIGIDPLDLKTTSPILFFTRWVTYPRWVVYLVWLSVILILYYPCKWYGKCKASHPQKKWLTYL